MMVNVRMGIAALGLLAAAAVLPGCATNAVNTAEACAGRNLANICPVGTVPRMDADATAECSGSAGVEVIQQSGSISGACASVGRCTVFCEPDPSMTCENGIAAITRDSVQCNEGSAGCGNGTCDAGETPETCAVDCSAVCSAGTERCNGANREVCNLRGQWESLACVAGERCVEEGGGETMCVPGTGGVAQDFVLTPPVDQSSATITNPNVVNQGNGQVVVPNVSNPTTSIQPQTVNPGVTQPVQTGGPVGTVAACNNATFDCLRAASGFSARTLSVPGRSGGDQTYQECSGWFASEPDHLIYLDTPFDRLQVRVDGGPEGTTLLIVETGDMDDGLVLCSQPYGGGSPVVTGSFPAGVYAVVVGAPERSRYYDYTLSISE